MFFDLNEDTLKISILLSLSVSKNFAIGSVSGRGGTWRTLMGFLTGDLEDRVILDTMDDLGGPQGSYPEGFMSLSLFLTEIYKLVVFGKKHDMIHQTEYVHTDTGEI